MDPSASKSPPKTRQQRPMIRQQSAPPSVQEAAELAASSAAAGIRLQVERRFTEAGIHPFDEVRWEKRTASIANEKGETVFEQTDCEIPDVLVADGDQRRGQQVFPGRSSALRGARRASSR